MNQRLHLIISGKVHQVFFRSFVKEKAVTLGLTGFVKNNPDGTVEVVAEGEAKCLAKLIVLCKKGPMTAEVSNVTVIEEPYLGEFHAFIRR